MSNTPELRTRLGARPRGGESPKRPSLKVPIEGKAFTQATQSEPMPICWGTIQRAGTYIIPVFNLIAVPVKTKAGK